MANRFAVAAGNFNDTATWSTTAAGSPGASVPVAGDNAIANTRTVTITANATCDNLTNGTNYGGTVGGSFVLNDGVTLTAYILSATNGSVNCVTYSGTTSASIVGTVTGSATSGSPVGVAHSGTGTLTITNASPHTNGRAFTNTSGGTITIIGNCTATGSGGSGPLITNSGSGTITVTGNLTGGSGGGSHGISNTSNGAVNVTGSVTGGSVSTAFGINNTSTGTVTVNSGTITATIAVAIVSTTATVRVSGNFIYASDGTIPVSAPKILLLTTPTASKTRYALNGAGTFVDMFTADNTGLGPTTNDVRSGVTYSGMTGSLAVPLPSQVAVGVPTDNTVGTAALTPAAVWEYATRTLTAGAGISASDVWSHASRTITGGLVDTATTLTNSPSVPSAASIASATRSELAVELARVDVATSSRLATSGYTAPTTPPTVTAIRQELDTNSTKLANLDATVSSRLATSGYTAPPTPPTAAANATAVRTELATELARVDVATSTRLAGSAYTAPSNSDVTAIKAKTDLLETTRLAQCSTVATTGAQLAAALS